MAGRGRGWPGGWLRWCRGVRLGEGRRHQAEAASAEVLAARLRMASSSSRCRWHQRPSGPGSSWPASEASRLGPARQRNDLRSQGRLVLPPMDEPTMPEAGARRFIADRYGDRASGLTLLGAGEWSRAYAFTLDGQAAVARFGAHGDDFAKDQVMTRFSTPGLPIPAVTDLGRTAHGYFVVSARAFGAHLDELDETGMPAVLSRLLRALDAIRDIDVARQHRIRDLVP